MDGMEVKQFTCFQQVYPSCLVDVERDYLALSRQYPKLSISPGFTKIVLHWPKGNLNLSLHTPVRFEHDLIEVDARAEPKEPSAEPLAEEPANPKCKRTVWNA
ncbi:protein SHORT ROOT IN SALT MEDIUM 1-like [Magnolia sinica]|uniref:protein SHORT ROOT IN SALT MEDIUM 1-like n=1 Tax=Magnolia sinica TaxID=86752 RepID=UPI00265A7451|nr:protein SHORT ROOT IN SALT MEDIUM 1-like [Magnolia sinica]XP_058083163.1 protein SHORT ROOT IN SALT MEDIUM 1-like [Magnolia sinica]